MVPVDDPVVWLCNLAGVAHQWDGASALDVRELGRVRRPRSSGRSRHVPALAYSVTTGAHLHLESGLEHDLLRELDRIATVVWLVSQPCRLRLPVRLGRRRVEHVPDLLSLADSGVVTVWDVRRAAAQDDDFTLKASFTRQACVEVGWQYRVFDGMSPVRRHNLMWLQAYRRPMPWYEASLRQIRARLTMPSTMGEVLAADGGAGHLVSAMWHGVWRSELVCDLGSRLTPTTALALAGLPATRTEP